MQATVIEQSQDQGNKHCEVNYVGQDYFVLVKVFAFFQKPFVLKGCANKDEHFNKEKNVKSQLTEKC